MYQLFTQYPYSRSLASRHRALRNAALAPSFLASSALNGLHEMIKEIDRQTRPTDVTDAEQSGTHAEQQAEIRAAKHSLRVPLNIWETDTAYVVEAELPGVSADALEISFEANRLTIRGSRQTTATETIAETGEGAAEEPRKRWNERYSGLFRRTVELPAKVDGERIDATLTDGILTLSVPKLANSEPKKIQVKAK